ncbi:MAG: peptide chain release factor-like protein [Akkermansia sp.]
MAVNRDKVQQLRLRMAQLGVLDKDLTESFVRGSGRGGQKINKTNNCVCLIHEPSGLVVRCHRERERETNRFLARRALCDELEFLQSGVRPVARRDSSGRSSSRHITVTRRKLGNHDASQDDLPLPLPDLSDFADIYNLDADGHQRA